MPASTRREPETENLNIERAREALATAQREEHRAGVERQAGRVTKSCHRDAVRVRIDAEARLRDALALAQDDTSERLAQDCSDGE